VTEPRSATQRDVASLRGRLALVGDIHLHFDDEDVAQLDDAGYDAVLFTGDLSDWDWRDGLLVARRIARLRTPAFVVPGNHDAVWATQILAEVLGWGQGVRSVLGVGQGRRVAALREALAPAVLGGFDAHRVPLSSGAITLICGRPHSMGGPRLSFPGYLGRAFGCHGLDDAAGRLRRLVDGRPREDALLFLAHNGPAGLGADRAAPCGCDFRPEEGDWGDPDLATALEHAVAQGRRVLGVLAGHMHHRLRGGGRRRTRGRLLGVPVVNAAEVPRHRPGPDAGGPPGLRRHHVRIEIDGDDLRAEDVWL